MGCRWVFLVRHLFSLTAGARGAQREHKRVCVCVCVCAHACVCACARVCLRACTQNFQLGYQDEEEQEEEGGELWVGSSDR